jgi:rubrerythrin
MSILDAMQAANRRKHRTDKDAVYDLSAPFTSNNELHGHELPPALNRMHCRTCGMEVVGTARCPKCGGGK